MESDAGKVLYSAKLRLREPQLSSAVGDTDAVDQLRVRSGGSRNKIDHEGDTDMAEETKLAQTTNPEEAQLSSLPNISGA